MKNDVWDVLQMNTNLKTGSDSEPDAVKIILLLLTLKTTTVHCAYLTCFVCVCVCVCRRTRSFRLGHVHVHRVFGEWRDLMVGIADRRRISGRSSASRAGSGHVSGRAIRADHRQRYQKLGFGHVAPSHAALRCFADHRIHAWILQLRPANRMGDRCTPYIDQHHGCKCLHIYVTFMV